MPWRRSIELGEGAGGAGMDRAGVLELPARLEVQRAAAIQPEQRRGSRLTLAAWHGAGARLGMEQVGQQVERHTPAGRAVRQDPDRERFGLEPHPARDGCAGLQALDDPLWSALAHDDLLDWPRTRRGVATRLPMIPDDCDNRSSIRRTSSDP